MSHSHQDSEYRPGGLRKHAKWITILMVGLMLAALAMYVLSDNESLQPGGKVQQQVPAAP